MSTLLALIWTDLTWTLDALASILSSVFIKAVHSMSWTGQVRGVLAVGEGVVHQSMSAQIKVRSNIFRIKIQFN